MQGQFRQQLVELALVAEQAQLRRIERRRQHGVRGQLRDAVGQPHREPRDLAARGGAHVVGDPRADPEHLVGARERGLPGFGHRHAAPRGLQQLMAARANPPSLTTTQ
ncbi:MAG: hypothetical protein GAK41_01626 [Burkholderia gladioli]|nr:MAG: hypothetical protein GAK41_01626 [Burkholderia gladioli]